MSSIFNRQQKIAYDTALSGANMWIVGPPGVGKSYVIGHICEELCRRGRRVEITAMTGTAAGQFKDGKTMHKFTRAGTESLKMHLASFVKYADKLPPKQQQELRVINTLIIDEAGMMGIDQIDHLDQYLKRIRGVRSRPFGGMQVILVGDIAQLPPCDTNAGAGMKRDEIVQVTSVFEYPDETKWKIVSLGQFVRSAEDEILQNVSMGLIDPLPGVRFMSVKLINKMCYKPEKIPNPLSCIEYARENGALIITPTNGKVDLYTGVEKVINLNMQKIMLPQPKPLYTYAELTKEQLENCGGFVGVEREDKEIRERNTFEQKPQFAIGQQIQIRRNGMDGETSYCNGDLCTIKSYDAASEMLVVHRTRDKIDISIAPCEHKTEYEEEVGKIGYKAVPVIPATATTIHKVQGQTLSGVIMDPQSIILFKDNIPNLLYVAVSRVKRLEHFMLTDPFPVDILHSDDIQKKLDELWCLDFMSEYPRADSAKLEAWLAEME